MTDHVDPNQDSPLSATTGPASVTGLAAERPVRFVLVAGSCDQGEWGVVGAFWLSKDGERGGFVVSPKALWRGSEMARSYWGALRRGWEPGQIYDFWRDQVGASGNVMIDPEQRAETLLHVYRRVGAR